ncbi:ArnT family glycosyltransferase [Brevundimonas sp. FT23028]|uniref:ArnT family glycosyltransferase n=1 Tax=Brevundimonas sp. FT23028 TaxID=3393748 RepID=UPI003B586393
MRARRLAVVVFLLAVIGVTVLRLQGLEASRAGLAVDEAQYWIWGQSPAWGYFSKPPLIGWLAGVADHLCGGGEACVRRPSTFAWALTAVLVCAAARMVYDLRAALFAGWAALLAPGAAFSARILSTDAPLLTLWSAALLAVLKLRAGGGWRWAIMLGGALGLGVLAKYAMLYAIGCLLLAVMFDRKTRRGLLSWKGAAALMIASAIVAPNVMWNLDHGLTTLKHTAGNAGADGLSPDLMEALTFLAAQAALAGPVMLVGWAMAVAATLTWRGQAADGVMTAFSLPILLALTALAGLATVNANWAAPALIAVWILGAARLERSRAGRVWMIAGLVLGAALQAALIVGDARADQLVIGKRPPYAQVLGAEAMADEAATAARRAGAGTIVAERRGDVARLAYALRDRSLIVKAWPAAAGQAPSDHFQAERPLTGREKGPVLAIAPCADAARFTGWTRVEPLGPVTAPTGPGRHWTAWLFRLEGPTGSPVRPATCPLPGR